MSRREEGTSEVQEITESELQNGAMQFELFWLRPARYRNREATVRLRLNSKLSGWTLKEGLVRSIGLSVGDCVNVEVTVLLGPQMIDGADDVDLFAGGRAAEWLLDTTLAAGTVKGCVMDCRVAFRYERAPVGQNQKEFLKASLVLLEGIRFVELEEPETPRTSLRELINALAGSELEA